MHETTTTTRQGSMILLEGARISAAFGGRGTIAIIAGQQSSFASLVTSPSGIHLGRDGAVVGSPRI